MIHLLLIIIAINSKSSNAMQQIIDNLTHQLSTIQENYLAQQQQGMIAQQSLITNNMNDMRNQIQVTLKQHTPALINH